MLKDLLKEESDRQGCIFFCLFGFKWIFKVENIGLWYIMRKKHFKDALTELVELLT